VSAAPVAADGVITGAVRAVSACARTRSYHRPLFLAALGAWRAHRLPCLAWLGAGQSAGMRRELPPRLVQRRGLLAHPPAEAAPCRPGPRGTIAGEHQQRRQGTRHSGGRQCVLLHQGASAVLGDWVRAHLLRPVTMRRSPHRQPHTTSTTGCVPRSPPGHRTSSACQQAPSSARRWPTGVVTDWPSSPAGSPSSAAKGGATGTYCRRAEASASATATTAVSGWRRSSATRYRSGSGGRL
jgi:hypothetical protein